MPPHTSPTLPIVVLASDRGDHMQAIIDAARNPDYGAAVVAVGSDRAGNLALVRATAADVPTFSVRVADYPSRAEWDAALTEAVAAHAPALVVSAGFMKILGPRFLDRFPAINVHPTLLPAFRGDHAVRQSIDYGVKVSGCTIHFIDEGVDTGPIIAQEAVAVLPKDTEASLHERIKPIEMRLLVEVIHRLAVGWCTKGRVIDLSDGRS